MENRVLLKHLIETLRIEHEIEIRDKDNYRLFNCLSNSQVLEPYLDWEVVQWFAYNNRKAVVLIRDEDDEEKEIASKFLDDVKKHFNENTYCQTYPWELTIKLYIKDQYYTIMLNTLTDRYSVSWGLGKYPTEFYSYKSIKEWLNEMCGDEILPDLDYCKYLTKDI